MEITQFAPVLIPTLNRHVHFKRCVESLAACTHAEKTELYIAFDYPLKEEHWDGYNIIDNYLPQIKGFKQVHIIRREENFGPYNNFQEALSGLFIKHDRLILSEDDNEFSVDFLNFVNKGLTVYEGREDIFAVTGYCYPVDISEYYPEEAFIWQGFAAWGVGIWRSKYEKVAWDKETALKEIKNFIYSPKDVYKHYKVANHFIGNKLGMLKRKEVYGDSYLSWYLIENNMYVVFPKISRVRNTGHDGSGVHCGNMQNNPYRAQKIHNKTYEYKLDRDIKSSGYINKLIYNHFKKSLKGKLWLLISILKYYITKR